MHELGIANEVLAVALSEAGKHGAEKVVRVTLSIGVLRGIVPDTLSFLFGHVGAGTIADGAELVVDEVPLTVVCQACGNVPARELVISCPKCGGDAITLLGGDELRISTIDVLP